ncbi:uncharacterized protein DFL_003534 [Arthrobotrys flagrans]|uniref:Uncharacterized protein n=1 Tax=Arthrobotrys flagrans TaxID=97331 RepID=A0A437A238_ARTFL|nr:hypothetical protein DFL_003534 [Arthrobotrys flagrans]
MASHSSLKRPPPQDPIPGSPTKKPRGMDAPGSSAVSAQDQKKKMVEEARARAAALAASLGNRAGSSAASKLSQPASASSPVDRMAALRARVAAAVGNTTSATPSKQAPALPVATPKEPMDVPQDGGRGRGGLDIGIHPALLADSVETSTGVGRGRQAMKPKFATTMANQKPDPITKQYISSKHKDARAIGGSKPTGESLPSKNPYFDPNINSGAGAHQKSRVSKGLVFNQKGKYIEQANALRKQAQLEELKARIAAAARRAGIEEDIDTDKMFLRDKPPEVEWWDQGLCSNGTYDDINSNSLKIDSRDSIITVYVQHPILLDPPMEKHIPPAKALPLTKKEQKKTRLQARMAKLKESQAKVRLGLEPPEPPKVTLKNMMRVMGDEAVKDPTAVEAKVNKQIAERLEKHLTANAERKLTKEQKLEKLHHNQEQDLAKGVHCLVFRIEKLTNPSHQFKIWKNAEQLALTGICINNPKFNLVVVEGGEWAINKYKKLMMQRIKWDENGVGGGVDAEGDSIVNETTPTTESNTCTLVWEGDLKLKAFKRFTTNKCESESEARRLLERNKVENYWTLAKAKGPTQT